MELGFDTLPDGDNAFASADPGGNCSFGEYELLEQIGRGGMGVVYKARQVALNRPVALKLISAGEFASPMLIQRFHREAEAAANLHHPNIVPIYETGEIHGQHYLSMALIEGVGLDAYIKRSGANNVPPDKDARSVLRARQEEVACIMAKVARAVDHAHQHGVLHRDLKPGNIIVDRGGEPNLTDFGVAKVLGDGDSNLTASGAIMGTPSYMAPEQAAGQSKRITIAADVYSLGAILYAMLTGRPPFRGDTQVETLRQVVEQEPKHPSTLREGIDGDLATIAMKCLEKEPQRRYASAGALAEDLERWLRREPILARPVGPLGRTWRWCRREPWMAALVAAVVVLLAAMSVLSTVTAMRFASKNENIEEEVQRNRATVNILMRRSLQNLEEMWLTGSKPFETIRSDELAALRGEPSISSQSDTNRLHLIFAVYTHEKPTIMLKNMAPVLGILEPSMKQSLSRPVQIDLRIYRWYDDAKDALVSGQVHFVRFGAVSYVEAKKINPKVSLLLAQNGNVRGYIFARTNSGIRSLTDLKGKSIAFVDSSSTAGSILPKRALLQAGLSAKDVRGGGTNYVDSHDTVVKAVASAKFDAGACNASIVDSFTNDTGIKFHILYEIIETKGLPWIASPSLDSAAAEGIRVGLQSITNAAMLRNLRNDTTGFEKVEDTDYNSIREALKDAEKFDAILPESPATR